MRGGRGRVGPRGGGGPPGGRGGRGGRRGCGGGDEATDDDSPQRPRWAAALDPFCVVAAAERGKEGENGIIIDWPINQTNRGGQRKWWRDGGQSQMRCALGYGSGKAQVPAAAFIG